MSKLEGLDSSGFGIAAEAGCGALSRAFAAAKPSSS